MTAGIYVRISQDREGAGLGVERQEKDCRDLAERLGIEVEKVYVDNDISAYSGKPRPKYAALMADVEAGTIGTIIAWHNDRLHRSPIELEHFISIIERTGCRVQTVQTGNIDLSNPAGRLIARQLGSLARYESEHKSARIARAAQQRAEQGRWHGSSAPYGYANTASKGVIEIDEDEAKVLKKMADLLLEKKSLHSIARYLNDQGIPTRQGKVWRTTTIRKALLNPAVAGRRVYQGQDAGKGSGSWPAVLDDATWQSCRALLLERAGKKGASGKKDTRGGRPPASLLGGMIRCGRCGGRMNMWRPSAGKYGYRCQRQPGRDSNCGRCEVSGIRVEETVRDLVIAELARINAEPEEEPDAVVYGGASVTIDDIEDAERMLKELAQAYAAKQISMGEWLTARQPIEERLSTARRSLTVPETTRMPTGLPTMSDAVAAQWDTTYSREDKRAYIGAVAEYIIVNPSTAQRGCRFDPNRIALKLRP